MKSENTDVTSRTQILFDAIIDNLPMMVTVIEAETGRFIVANKACETVFGTGTTIIGKTLHDFLPKDAADSLATRDRAVIKAGRRIEFEYEHKCENGPEWIFATTMIPLCGESREQQYLLGIHQDITQRRKAEEEVAYLAHHDCLTGLENRTSFSTKLDESFRYYKDGGAFALIFVDLDDFKLINDSFGHPFGDRVLKCVANRLKDIIGAPHHVARLGGDEFAIIINGISSLEGLAAVIDHVVATIGRPIEECGHALTVTASVGAATAPQDVDDPAALLRNADIALYQAKKEGGNTKRLFDAQMLENFNNRLTLEDDLRRALDNNELCVYYQPLVSLKDNCVTGFEALLRWNSPTRGLVSPADFIPLAEETGLIGAIGAWVLKRACLDAANWPHHVRVAVNVSAVQFRNRTILLDVAAALGVSNLNPNRLELEITESTMLYDAAGTIDILNQLRGMCVKIAMDDFGTGYSSLAYLTKYAFDRVKIDRAFVQGIVDNNDSLAIIRAITGLCASLNIPITAEGVETMAQLERLHAEGCTSVQGYLLGRPAPIEAVEGMLGRDPKRDLDARAVA